MYWNRNQTSSAGFLQVMMAAAEMGKNKPRALNGPNDIFIGCPGGVGSRNGNLKMEEFGMVARGIDCNPFQFSGFEITFYGFLSHR
jgi:hypothetical protein